MDKIVGAFPTMITPYTKAGEVDYETAERYVDWYYQKGCEGIFAVCQSSEIFFLTREERKKLAQAVVARARKLENEFGRRMTVVCSGHVSWSPTEQVKELLDICESGADGLILITNRLDPDNKGDDEWIKNAEALLEALPKDMKLGLYECPYPYKRLVTERILRWCISTGRFYFMKDTCCDAEMIAERNEILKGSCFKLLNANSQTLLASLRSGGAGYCGVMCNFHPELYVWLVNNFQREPEKAELVQAFLCTAGFVESGLPYPLTAKYNMCLQGIETQLITRNPACKPMTAYAMDCIKQLKILADSFNVNQ